MTHRWHALAFLAGLCSSCFGGCPDTDGSTAGEVGGPCLQDGGPVCRDGLVCLSDLCVEPEHERGSGGGACYPNETCDDGLVCISAVCIVAPEQGAVRGACFPNSSCNEGLTCLSGVCVELDEGDDVDAGTDGGAESP